jgi:uncharacterized protein (TIGR03067 family)
MDAEVVMRRRFLMSVALGILGTALATAQETRTDLDKLQGTWRAVDQEIKGKKVGEKQFEKIALTLTIAGSKYTEKMMGETSEEGTFKLTTDKNPKQMDIHIGSGKDKGKTQLALFKLEGDTLFVAISPAESTERPTSLSTGPDSKFVVQIFRREKK